jgi:hypothetical protein
MKELCSMAQQRCVQRAWIFFSDTHPSIVSKGAWIFFSDTHPNIVSKGSRYYGFGGRPIAEYEARTVFFSKTLLSIDS